MIERNEKAEMLAGRLYLGSDPHLVEERVRARELLRAFNATAPDDLAGRRALLTTLFGAVGDDPFVEPPFRCDYGYNIRVGARFYANFGCVFLDVTRITIGDDVLLAPSVHLYTATHPLEADVRASALELGAPITIGDRAWLGGGVIVCPGVTIGSETVVGAGSVVTRDLPDRVLAVGNPCRVVRSLAP